MRAARGVFGSEGYTRTTIDMIATEAAVSTRTVYNHFEGKEQLFSAVLLASATHVTDGFIADVDARLTGADPEADILSLGHACAAVRSTFPEHFAMVEQITVEALHFPPATIAAWQQAGPLRFLDQVARCLRRFEAQGLLRLGDPARAAVHFSALVTTGHTTWYETLPASDERISEGVVAGVEAFLNGYAATPRAPPPSQPARPSTDDTLMGSRE